MPRLRLRAVLLSCLLVAAAAPVAPALAQSPATVDCYHHNRLTGRYTVAQLQTALSTMSSSVREYSPCYQIIQAQLFRQIGGKSLPGGRRATGTSSGGSTPWLLIAVVIAIVLVGGGLALAAGRRGRGGGGIPPAAAAG